MPSSEVMAETNSNSGAASALLSFSPAIWSRFAELFLICGINETRGLELEAYTDSDVDILPLPPLERCYKPEVLAFCPSDATGGNAATFDPNSVRMLCLPRGLMFYTQRNVKQPQFHPFIITKEDGSRYFGFSLVFYEEVVDEKLRQAMKTLQEMFVADVNTCRDARFASLQVRGRSSYAAPSTLYDPPKTSAAFSSTLPRSFKAQFVEQNSAEVVESVDPLAPSNNASFSKQQQLPPPLYDIEKDKLFVSKSICFVSIYPFASAFKMLLFGLYHRAISQSTQATQVETANAKVWLPLESYVFNVLYEIPVPPPGHSVQCVCFPHNEIIIHMPGALELPLLDCSLRELFATFDVTKIVDLLTGAALEHQILLYSQDCGRLMLVAESLVALLFPFTWQSVYVPILPSSLHCFLDAPVPFIMGLHGPRQNALSMSRADMCFANIDDGTIHLPEEMPKLPLRKELCQILHKLYITTYPDEQRNAAASDPSHNRSRSRSSTPGVFHTATNAAGGDSSEVKQLTNELAEMISKLDADTSAAVAACDADGDAAIPSAFSDTIDVEPAKSPANSEASPHTTLTKWNNPPAHHFTGMRRTKEIISADAARTNGSSKAKSKVNKIKTSVAVVGKQPKRSAKAKQAAAAHASILNFAAPLSDDAALQQRLRDAQFDECVRRSFLLAFVYLMFSYETYIIHHTTVMSHKSDKSSEDQVDCAHAPPDHNFIMDDPSASVLSPSLDTTENFDKVAFLSDQPERNLKFLSSFLSTQLFASFIDKKSLEMKRAAPLLSVTTPVSANFAASSVFEFPNAGDGSVMQRTPTAAGAAGLNDAIEFKNVHIFDDTIRCAREKCGEEVEFRKLTFKKFLESMTIDMTQLIARLSVPTMYAAEPHRLPLAVTKSANVLNSPSRSNPHHYAANVPHKFPTLDASLLSIEYATAVFVATGMTDTVLPTTNAASSTRPHSAGSPKKFSSVLASRMAARITSHPISSSRHFHHSHHHQSVMSPSKAFLPANMMQHRRNLASASAATTPQTPQASQSTMISPPNILPNVSRQLSTADIAQTNASFIESILKECKQKSKKMLMAKMGHEAVEQLGLTQAEAISGVEENTQISSLCDLIERIWTHGRNSMTNGASKQQCKSALWHHVLLYQQLHEKISPNSASSSFGAVRNGASQPSCDEAPAIHDGVKQLPATFDAAWSVNNNADESVGAVPYNSLYEQLQEAKSKGFEHVSKIVSYMSSASLYTTPPVTANSVRMNTDDEDVVEKKERALYFQQAAAACIQSQHSSGSGDEFEDDEFGQNPDEFNSSKFRTTDDADSNRRSSGPATTLGFLGGTLDRQKFRLGSLKSRFRSNVAALSSSVAGQTTTSEQPNYDATQHGLPLNLSRINSASRSIPPPPLTSENFAERALLRDIRHVTHSVASVKSAVGYARAFIRLALEKKLLSQHLKTLLADEMILNRIFKPYAFLRSDDEREQFLFHILSLNAVDYFCFTNTYLDTHMPMTIGVNATGSSNATLWAALCGTHCHTDPFYIPRGAHNYTVKPKNIGLVELVKIGLVMSNEQHAQPLSAPAGGGAPAILPTRSRTASAGGGNSFSAPASSTGTTTTAGGGNSAARLWVDEVVIRNQITGHVYRFACNRWLGRGVDDEATERWLIGRRVCICTGSTPTTLMPTSILSGSIVDQGATATANSVEIPLRISDDIDEELLAEQQSNFGVMKMGVGPRHANATMPGAPHLVGGAGGRVLGAQNVMTKNIASPSTDKNNARGRSVEPTAGRASLNASSSVARVTESNAGNNLNRLRSPSVPRQLAGEGKLTTTQIERLLGESANVLVKHFHHAQLQPSNVNGTLRVRGSNSSLLRNGNNGSSVNDNGHDSEHAYVNPFVLLCRPNGIVSRLELAMYVGFRASRFSLWEGTKQFFLWDFIERAAQHFRMEVLLRGNLTPAVRAYIEKFCALVKGLDENAGVLGKDGKFRLFVCLSLRDKCLAQNVDLMSRTPSIDVMFDERCLLRNKELKPWLIKLLDSLTQYNIFFDPAFTKGL